MQTLAFDSPCLRRIMCLGLISVKCVSVYAWRSYRQVSTKHEKDLHAGQNLQQTQCNTKIKRNIVDDLLYMPEAHTSRATKSIR